MEYLSRISKAISDGNIQEAARLFAQACQSISREERHELIRQLTEWHNEELVRWLDDNATSEHPEDDEE